MMTLDAKDYVLVAVRRDSIPPCVDTVFAGRLDNESKWIPVLACHGEGGVPVDMTGLISVEDLRRVNKAANIT